MGFTPFPSFMPDMQSDAFSMEHAWDQMRAGSPAAFVSDVGFAGPYATSLMPSAPASPESTVSDARLHQLRDALGAPTRDNPIALSDPRWRRYMDVDYEGALNWAMARAGLGDLAHAARKFDIAW